MQYGIKHNDRESICEALRKDLLTGKFDFEQPIREQKLAERFGTSRGPVRDALLRLTQGVLVYEPNKGVRVSSPLTDAERDVVVSMRLCLEKFCLEAFIRDAKKHHFLQLSFLLERLHSACERASLPEVAECDLALHLLGRSSLSSFGILVVRIKCKNDHEVFQTVEVRQVIEEHNNVIHAVMEKDVEKALFYLGESVYEE